MELIFSGISLISNNGLCCLLLKFKRLFSLIRKVSYSLLISISNPLIFLESEDLSYNKVLGKNPFSLMISLFGHLMDQVEKGDIAIGKLAAKYRNVKLNLYYTPTKLTENALIFNKHLMEQWWKQGYEYAESKHSEGQTMDQSPKIETIQ